MSEYINAAISGILRQAASRVEGAHDKEVAGMILSESHHVARAVLAIEDDGTVKHSAPSLAPATPKEK